MLCGYFLSSNDLTVQARILFSNAQCKQDVAEYSEDSSTLDWKKAFGERNTNKQNQITYSKS